MLDDENLSLLQLRSQKHHVAAQGSDECQEGIAYHSGPMVNGNAPADNANECTNQCSLEADCHYWDFAADGHCRLRSHRGEAGAQADSSSVAGAKGCSFPQCNSDIAYHSGHMVDGNAPASNAEQCRDQCNQNSECLFWDLVGGTCRLRSETGGDGARDQAGGIAGARRCTLPAVPVTDPAVLEEETAPPTETDEEETPEADEEEVEEVAPPVADEASAVGDPHITTMSGAKSDLCCKGGVCKSCPPK